MAEQPLDADTMPKVVFLKDHLGATDAAHVQSRAALRATEFVGGKAEDPFMDADRVPASELWYEDEIAWSA